MPKQYAVVVDILLVTVFAAVGRSTHGESMSPAGVFETAWPFLTALLVAWAVMLIRRRDHLGIGAGIFVWFITWAGGLTFRVAGGETAEVPFIIVAALVLLVFLAGWRIALGFFRPRRLESSTADQ